MIWPDEWQKQEIPRTKRDVDECSSMYVRPDFARSLKKSSQFERSLLLIVQAGTSAVCVPNGLGFGQIVKSPANYGQCGSLKT